MKFYGAKSPTCSISTYKSWSMISRHGEIHMCIHIQYICNGPKQQNYKCLTKNSGGLESTVLTINLVKQMKHRIKILQPKIHGVKKGNNSWVDQSQRIPQRVRIVQTTKKMLENNSICQKNRMQLNIEINNGCNQKMKLNQSFKIQSVNTTLR